MQVRTIMSPPGYVIIPLDSKASGDWRFGASRDHGHLSPVTVSRTLQSLVRRVIRKHCEGWTILPFDMDADRSPVAGNSAPQFNFCVSCQTLRFQRSCAYTVIKSF